MTMRYIDSDDGTRLAVYEEGNPDGPTVVLVHGWPDSHVLWDGVVPLLADKFRIIRYDNRGAGGSSGPKSFSSYTMAHLADDFAAVIGELSPGEPVHVLAHDWGSATMWEYVARPGAADRVASFTSVSGPAADHFSRYVRDGLKRPYRPKLFSRALSQGAHLSYMAAFSVPVLAPAIMRAAATPLLRMVSRGIPARQRHHGQTFSSDAANGLKIYRANFFHSLLHVRSDRYVEVPVQLIVNLDDPYVRPYVYDDTPRWAPRLWRRDIRAGHWSPMSHPQVLAAAVTELAEHLDGKPASRALLRAQVSRPRKHFGDMLVSVTGAGSGIGRETALAFAREGAEVVVSDIDEAAVKETVARIGARGGVAHPYVYDVSDADAVERFADQVCAERGVPDIVVNNAGIGAAGAFLDTPAEQFDRVLDVNLGGVVNGCRAFARRLVDRGTGGHIVNVASMAAYAPLQSMNAYCTSKAAVYMFSDCLRAELDSAGVGLTTICPGLINTNIVSTTQLYAPEDKRSAVAPRRAQLEKMFELRGYGPDKVAAAIVSAVKKNKPIRPVAPEAYLLYGTSRILPQVMRSTARGKVL
ncbi:SDR family oxidoreductase [Mycobacterium sp. CVI_P3]|uniref:SDR family oxidoreductase n=1 Tax=Mycobacterium pinniadriaticum TaxID=2994102 RepID=A0ABT3SJT8_9MYCO|nr:SDR family oxidoreductase [Mycobacterium pinniadriaticum]MCX2933291.1 SDR family oxidoreductase [Mycobacterium pinniadriaticum]MCX2939713.1 SDR family oxidoreductase [Mycobacterium pinniadriaticum]